MINSTLCSKYFQTMKQTDCLKSMLTSFKNSSIQLANYIFTNLFTYTLWYMI